MRFVFLLASACSAGLLFAGCSDSDRDPITSSSTNAPVRAGFTAPPEGAVVSSETRVAWSDPGEGEVELRLRYLDDERLASIFVGPDDGEFRWDTARQADGKVQLQRYTVVGALLLGVSDEFWIDNTPPEVTLLQPAAGARLGAQVEVTWTTRDAHRQSASLELRGADGVSEVLARAEPDQGRLVVSLSGVAAGSYTLVLRVRDAGGNETEVEREVVLSGEAGGPGEGPGGGSDDPGAPPPTRAALLDANLDAVASVGDVLLGVSAEPGIVLPGLRELQQLEVDADVMASGDFDGDGDADLIVANEAGLSLLSNREGRLELAASEPLPEVHALASADLSGEGELELIVGREGTNYVYRIRPGASGRAIFERVRELGAGRTRALLTGDFDRDGDEDVLVGNLGPDEVFENLASAGRRALRRVERGVDEATTSLAALDVDGDTLREIVAAGPAGLRQLEPLRRVRAAGEEVELAGRRLASGAFGAVRTLDERARSVVVEAKERLERLELREGLGPLRTRLGQAGRPLLTRGLPDGRTLIVSTTQRAARALVISRDGVERLLSAQVLPPAEVALELDLDGDGEPEVALAGGGQLSLHAVDHLLAEARDLDGDGLLDLRTAAEDLLVAAEERAGSLREGLTSATSRVSDAGRALVQGVRQR